MTTLPSNERQPASRQRRRHRLRVNNRSIAAIAVLMALVFSACSSSTDNAVDTASDASGAVASRADLTQAEVAYDEASYDDADYGDSAEADRPQSAQLTLESASENGVTTTGAAGSQPTAQLPDLGRDIIFTATIELASTDVSTATREAIQAIESRGGFLFSQETRGGAGGTSVLTFKVLPDQFQAALNDLGSVGEVRAQTISADDVSAVVVDLESRINTAEASVIRLRNLLDGATELETIATLENQLLQRETTLEQLRGQLRSVRSQVDLATITVYVAELLNRPGIGIDTMTFAGHDGGFSCFDAPTTRSGEAGDALTTCYRIFNTGDTPLVDVTIDDSALGATIGSMVVVDGDIAQIDPGETVVLAHEFELSEPVRVRTSVTATGLDIEGNPVGDDVKATAPTVRFDVTDIDDGFPSFGEVLGNSLGMLAAALVWIALIAVAIAPFVLVAAALGYVVLQVTRRVRALRPPKPARATPPPPPENTDANEEATIDA